MRIVLHITILQQCVRPYIPHRLGHFVGPRFDGGHLFESVRYMVPAAHEGESGIKPDVSQEMCCGAL